MKQPRRIVICGTSIYMMAIETGLRTKAELEVLRVNPHLPNAAERIAALKPDAFVVERDDHSSRLVMALLGQGFPLMFLDPLERKITILVGHQVLDGEIDDPSTMIEKISRRRYVLAEDYAARTVDRR